MKLLLTVNEFCDSAGISRFKFYGLNREGKGPPITKIGSRTLIKVSDAEAWTRDLPTQIGRNSTRGAR